MTNSDRHALTSVSCVDMNIYFASRGLEENHKLEGEVHVVSDAEHHKVLLMALENLLKFVEEGHRLFLMGDVCDRVNRELRDKIYNFDNVLLSCSARAVAIISEVLGSRELYLLLEKALFKASFSGSAYRLNSAGYIRSSLFVELADCFRNCLNDKEFPDLHEMLTKLLGKLLLCLIQYYPSESYEIEQTIGAILLATQDDDSKVKIRVLVALATAGKEDVSVLNDYDYLYGPALAECLKDKSGPVKLAAGRCVLHTLRLRK